MIPTQVSLAGLGVFAPGMNGWGEACQTLRGEAGLGPPPGPPPAALLPANERRRTTATIRLALQVAAEAVDRAGLEHPDVAAVFATSGGDYDVLNSMCSAIASGGGLSPTLFHNSVHNAAAGYWSIATGSHRPTTTVSAWDSSFAFGLLEAAAVVMTDQVPTLLVAYDRVPPEPLRAKRPLAEDFAVALLLVPGPQPAGFGRLALERTGRTEATRMTPSGLERLRLGNPAARALPLLEAISRGKPAQTVLDCGHQSLLLRFEPCPP